MSYISLYRKYRPRKFSEVVGQEIIVKILKNSIINNKIGHAYIFSGPRGTGKTSIAKIFARAVNCLNPADGDVCDNCDICKLSQDEELDIIEIDAASNNGVDEIREIKNTIKLMPSLLKYKVYIVDEVHMLSTSAFNALLKTLEEPPAHAIFILATTEINKIPATVLSRCQKFDFKKIKKEDIVNRLNYILKEEKLEIDEEVINTIAELSDGGLRDAINLLDQLISLNKEKITRNDVYNIIGSTDYLEVFPLLKAITNFDIKEVIRINDSFYNSGKNINNVISSLEKIIKDIIIFNNVDNYFNKDYEEMLYQYSKIDVDILLKMSSDLFDLVNEIKKNSNHKIITDIYLLKLTMYFSDNKKQNKDEKIEEKIELGNNIQNDTPEKVDDKNNDILSDEKDILINNVLCKADKKLKIEFNENYHIINDYLTKKEYNSLANLLIKATPEVVSEETVLFTFDEGFEIVLFDKNINEIISFLKLIYGNKYNVVAITKDKWKDVKKEYIQNTKAGKKYEYIELTEKKRKTKKKNTELQNSIESIFGEEYTQN